MKNLKAIKLLVASCIALGASTAWSHGSLELIECHNKDNTVVFRGEAINKENDFKFSLMKNNEKIWSDKKIRLQLKDTVENKTVMENIGIKSKDGSVANIKVVEVYSREIRNGTGELTFTKPKLTAKVDCYAVY